MFVNVHVMYCIWLYVVFYIFKTYVNWKLQNSNRNKLQNEPQYTVPQILADIVRFYCKKDAFQIIYM